ncbi:uncharacterized protein LOC112342454 [Selaginella moellendorffii]|uniref:uncharacterized protein LOC112342454 n=1 Tax=Selaginella moellendorffii TaxID=88036 RepID=UPI000D1CBA5E|nr:uncharacterized protein LOC112342454 [Selaginella moellendorffii]|eukprot:XP_024520067.1 uncharacterized protein LOC112342454 [Selaginella moellendorffii]
MSYCSLWFDGASRGNGTGSTVAGYGFVLQDPRGAPLVQASEFLGYDFTNNQAEYKALIAGLRKARAINIKNIYIRGDSELVVYQVRGIYKARNPTLRRYLSEVMDLLDCFDIYATDHVRREQNQLADALAIDGLRKIYDDYCYGYRAILQCCYYDAGAWKYLLNQRVRGYWRMKYMLSVIQEEFPDVYDVIEGWCYGLGIHDQDDDIAHILALY